MQRKVVDFRVRPPVPSFRDRWPYRESGDPSRPQELPVIERGRAEAVSAKTFSLDLFWDELNDAGITRAVLMSRAMGPGDGVERNREIAAFKAAHHPRFEAFVGLNGLESDRAIRDIRSAREAGFLGVAIDNGLMGLHQDDEQLWPIYQAVAEEGLILAVTASLPMGADSSYAHPNRIRPIAKRFSSMPIVISHASWPWVVDACALAYECPNIYLLPDCYLNTQAPGSGEYVVAANTFLEDRLLYGSSYPIRPLGSSLSSFVESGLSDTALTAALWDNPTRLLEKASTGL